MLQTILSTAIGDMDLAVSQQQQQQLISYVELLHKWNKTYNLTAVRDAESMMKRHVIDALSVVSDVAALRPRALADIGTGGGIPGIVLAVMFPEMRVFLVESIGKKCRFLRQVIASLGLADRVEVVQQRVESWSPDCQVDVVICRAFASLYDFMDITTHLGQSETTWLAMKSDKTQEELKHLPAGFALYSDVLLTVPFEGADRHLLTFKKDS